jgi:hypothetical protein
MATKPKTKAKPKALKKPKPRVYSKTPFGGKTKPMKAELDGRLTPSQLAFFLSFDCKLPSTGQVITLNGRRVIAVPKRDGTWRVVQVLTHWMVDGWTRYLKVITTDE